VVVIGSRGDAQAWEGTCCDADSPKVNVNVCLENITSGMAEPPKQPKQQRSRLLERRSGLEGQAILPTFKMKNPSAFLILLAACI
jgi:hypothetical protein